MIGYRDMTFCVSPECTNACGRKFTKEIAEAADKWYRSWAKDDPEGHAPVSVSMFCGGTDEDWKTYIDKDQEETMNEHQQPEL